MKAFFKVLVSTAIFLGILLAVTWPMALHLEEGIAGMGKDYTYDQAFTYADIYQYAGNFRQFLGQPFNLKLLNLSPDSNLSLLQLTFGEYLGYNLWWILSFLVAFLGGYLLQLYLSKNHPAAFITGLALALFPFHFAHSYGHRGAIWYGLLAWFALFLLRYLKNFRWRDLLGVGFIFYLIAQAEGMLLLYTVLLALFIFIYLLITKKLHPPIKFYLQILLVIIAGGICIWVSSGHLVKVAFSDNNYLIPEFDKVIGNGLDVLSALVPPSFHILRQEPGLAKPYEGFSQANAFEATAYAGIFVLALAAYATITALRRKSREIYLWIALTFGFWILSLGPALHIAGKLFRQMPLPYIILYEIFPFMNVIRTTSRIYAVALVGLAVLAGWGVAQAITAMRAKSRKPYSLWLATYGLLALLIVLDFSYFNFPCNPPRVSKFYTDILPKDPGQFYLIQIPGNYEYAASSEIQYANTFHIHPSWSKMDFAREGMSDWSWHQSTPVLRDLFYRVPQKEPADIIDYDPAQIGLQILQNEAYVRYVIIHKQNLAEPDYQRTLRYCESLGLLPDYEDDLIKAFLVPPTTGEKASYVALQDGIRLDKETPTGRDATGPVTLRIQNGEGQERPVSLTLDLYSETTEDRLLSVEYRGQTLKRTTLYAYQSATIQLDDILVSTGDNFLTLKFYDTRDREVTKFPQVKFTEITYTFSPQTP